MAKMLSKKSYCFILLAVLTGSSGVISESWAQVTGQSRPSDQNRADQGVPPRGVTSTNPMAVPPVSVSPSNENPMAAFAAATNTEEQSRAELMRGDAADQGNLVRYGHYLTRIGACEACHTPPVDISAIANPLEVQQLRSNPDWTTYLDPLRRFAGGVPFIVRFTGQLSGVVVSRNLTPDSKTGLGNWTTADIVRALKHGQRPDGTNLFLFPPHTYYPNMADLDAQAIAEYLKSLPAVEHVIQPRNLPFPVSAVPDDQVSKKRLPPTEPSLERARYLTSAMVGCVECHSNRANDGKLNAWVGGNPNSKVTGAFKLGPDLPLTQTERGLASWPYPGYAMLLAPNLTVYGQGGRAENASYRTISRAIRQGISTFQDRYKRPVPLSHTMLWQFYSSMSDADILSIAMLLKSLPYQPGYEGNRIIYLGDDWRNAFEFMYGEKPTDHDKEIFGK